jgi:hypothetical protein
MIYTSKLLRFAAYAVFGAIPLLGYSATAEPETGSSSETDANTEVGTDTDENSDNDVQYSITGTLPVLYINTENATPITSKEEYVNATYYLDMQGLTTGGGKNLGTEANQLPLQIRGRGNSTWTKLKKPYKIKLDSKTALMGLNKSKHFALMAYASSYIDVFTSTLGFELAKKLGFAWTPEQQPIELVINGEFQGLYFVTENVRVEKNRVNITEQDDLNTNEATINGGWLVEIDNYDDDSQIRIQEQENKSMRITYHSPEELSTQQEEWLTNEFTKINAAIYNPDKNSHEWENYLDIDMLARFVIVQEVMNNLDAYVGSWYLNKDLGEDKKWMCGPVWDLLWSGKKSSGTNDYVWNSREASITKWMPELWKFPALQNKIVEIWTSLDKNIFTEIYDNCQALATEIEESYNYDSEMWQAKGLMKDTHKSLNAERYAQSILAANVEWLDQHWNTEAISFHTINIASEEGGKVTIDGYLHDQYTVADGASAELNFIPDSGYILQTVLLDDVDITEEVIDNCYTLSDITTDHTITATFKSTADILTQLTIAVPDGGKFTIKSKYGDTETVTITPMNGWSLHSVTFDGIDVTDLLVDNMYKTPELHGEDVIIVIFEQKGTDSSAPFETEEQVHLAVSGHELIISGNDSELVTIYDVNGTQIYQGKESHITLDSGIYIVTLCGKTYKLAI